jgi:hypothetical protein
LNSKVSKTRQRGRPVRLHCGQMEQIDRSHFSHQFERPLRDGCADILCDFDLPSEGWPWKSRKDVALEDPMTALIWRGWIAGIANIEK